MAGAESKLKQRIVGAVVLIAVAVIFLPMLLKQEDPARTVVVDAPPMPAVPAQPQYPVTEVAVPEPVIDDEWDGAVITEQPLTPDSAPAQPVAVEPAPAVAVVTQPVKPAVTQPVSKKPEQPVIAPGIDKNNLPVSWSVQLASLTNKANAEALRDTYRNKQYNAYVRSSDGVHRVLIGPLIREAEAQAMCKGLKAREKQECFVVRYQP